MNLPQFSVHIVLVALLCAAVMWLRTFPFREKKTKEPERTAKAELLSRHVQSGNPIRSGRSSGMGYTYVALFRLEDGQEMELYSHDYEWGALKEGDQGMLTWKGPYFVRFETEG